MRGDSSHSDSRGARPPAAWFLVFSHASSSWYWAGKVAKCSRNTGDCSVAPLVSSTVLFPSPLSSQPLSLAHRQAGEAAAVELELELWSVRMSSSPQGHGPAVPPPNLHRGVPLRLHLHLLDQDHHYLLSECLSLFSVWASWFLLC